MGTERTERLDLLLEAERRGLLREQDASVVAEARKRGLIGQPPESPVPPESQAPPESPGAMARVGRGMMDVAQGTKQAGLMTAEALRGNSPLLAFIPQPLREFGKVGLALSGIGEPGQADAYTKEVSDEISLYERGRKYGARKMSDLITGAEPDPGIDWLRLGGNIAASAPISFIPGAGAASLPSRAAIGATQGMLAAGTTFTPEGDSKTGQVALGGVVGAAVPYAIEAIKQSARAIKDIALKSRVTNPVDVQAIERQLEFTLGKQGVSWGALTQDARTSLVDEVRKAVTTSGASLDETQLGRIADIKSIGGQPFKAAVTRDPRDWQTFKNLRGVENVGEPIVKAEERNAKAMIDYLANLRGQSGGRPGTPYQAGENAIDAISSKEREMQELVGNLYKDAEKHYSKALAVQPTKLLAVMDDLSVRFDADPLNQTVQRFLAKRSADGYVSAKEGEELRKLIRNVTWDKGPSMRQMGNRMIDALDDDVFSGFGAESPFRIARDNAKAKFAEFEGKIARGAVEGTISPEDFVQKYLINGKVDDLREARRVLRTGTNTQIARGEQAWNDLRGQLYDHFMLKATGAKTLEDVAGQPFSFARFSRAVNEIEPEKLHLLFSPTELADIRTLERAAKWMTAEVPFSDVNHSKTTSALANLIQHTGTMPRLNLTMRLAGGAMRKGKEMLLEQERAKQVAEQLIASAVREAQKAPSVTLPASRVSPALPAVAYGALNEATQRSND